LSEVKKKWFEVDIEGMREFHGSRQGWQLAKELVANSFDEETSFCDFQLTHNGKTAHLVVEDDGPGFRNINDAYTILGSTYKRSRPDLRGRFNLGEKELIAVSNSAVVETVGKRVVFAAMGERREEPTNRKRGTRIELDLPWSNKKVEETITRMKRVLPPKGITYRVNGNTVPYREPCKEFEATLETVLLERGFMRKSMRKTWVHLHKPAFGDRPMLFELGIPVQAIGCAYHIDVKQKIPMNPNRDAVKAQFLKDLYAETLNHTIDEIPEEKIAQEWARQAIEDSRTTPEVVKKAVVKRFGEKIVLWSSDTQANEKALESGYELVKPKELSPIERERFVEVAGIKHASDLFPNDSEKEKKSKPVEPTPAMQVIAEYTKRIAPHIIGREIQVRFYSLFGEGVAASFNRASETLSFNVASLGYEWFEQGISSETTALILHELAHQEEDPNISHGPIYKRSLQIVAGKAVMLARDNPQLFH
jgi:hypothetical protein